MYKLGVMRYTILINNEWRLTMFMIQGLAKISDQDDYKNGYIDGTTQSSYVDRQIEAETVPQLFAKLAEEYGISETDFTIDADEQGFFSFGVQETESGDLPTDVDIAAWQQGKYNLYIAQYSGFVLKTEKVRLALVEDKVIGY